MDIFVKKYVVRVKKYVVRALFQGEGG